MYSFLEYGILNSFTNLQATLQFAHDPYNVHLPMLLNLGFSLETISGTTGCGFRQPPRAGPGDPESALRVRRMGPPRPSLFRLKTKKHILNISNTFRTLV